MNGNCSLKSDGKGGYTQESINEVQKIINASISDAIDKAEDSGDFSKNIKKYIRKALANIGDNINNRFLKQVTKFTEPVIAMYGLEDAIPSIGIQNAISKRFRSSESDSFNKGEIEEMEEDFINSSFFLDETFGNKGFLKNKIKLKALSILLNNFIIDRENEELVISLRDANNKVRALKNKLFESYIRHIAEVLKTEKISLDGLDLRVYNDEQEYTNILENDKISKLNSMNKFKILNPNQIEDMYYTRPADFEVFQDWYIFENYDNFVNLLLGDIITVNPEYKNKFITGDSYMYTGGSTIIRNFRYDNDDVILNEEINNVVKYLVTTTPRLKFNQTKLNATGDFITFDEFNKVITKFKNLVYSNDLEGVNLRDTPISSINTLNVLRTAYMGLSERDKALVKDMSFKELINNLGHNPMDYSRIALKLFLDSGLINTIGNFNNERNIKFSEKEKEVLYSVYKGIFDDYDTQNTSSIISIMSKYDPSKVINNYYEYITLVISTILSVDYLQIYNDGFKSYLRSLRQQKSDSVRRDLERKIKAFNSRNISKNFFKEIYMDPYQASPIINKSDNDHLDGISFVIDGITVEYNPGVVNYYDSRRVPLSDSQIEKFLQKDSVKLFMLELLLEDFINNTQLNDILEELYKQSSLRRELFKAASEIYFNRYISNVVLKNEESRSKMLQTLDNIYKNSEYKPKFNYDTYEILVVSDKTVLGALSDLATAIALANNLYFSGQVLDGEGNQLSQETLNRLIGNIDRQFDEVRRYWKSLSPEDRSYLPSILKNNVYKGHYTIKDFKSLVNTKTSRDFTESEFGQAFFLYGFIEGLANTSNKQIISNGTVGFLPAAYSDKNTIGLILIDLAQKVGRNAVNINPDKKFLELNSDEIYELAASELKHSYELTYSLVKNDYIKLINYVRSKGIEIEEVNDTNGLDLYDNLNNYVDNLSPTTKALDVLNSWIYAYNNDPIINDRLEFISNVYYELKDGLHLETNRVLKYYINDKFASFDNFKKFMTFKEAEVFNSLINNNSVFDLYSSSDPSPALKYLTDIKGWVKNGKMVIGKINYNGKDYNITSKADLIEFENILRNDGIINYDIHTDPHNILNVPNLKFTLHPSLIQFNGLHYLFSQEFVTNTVGSLIAHSSKPGLGPLVEESAKYLGQSKRNVSLTATMHLFLKGSITGIPSKYKISVVNDIPAYVYSMMGDTKNDLDSMDAATFVEPATVILEQNSLGGNRAGIVKKPYFHWFNSRTRTAFMDKTAGFGITNDRARNDYFIARLAKKMMSQPWLNEDGTIHEMKEGGVLIDYNGSQIDYGPIYLRRDGKHYLRTIESYDRIGKYYNITETEVDEFGDILLDDDGNAVYSEPGTFSVNNNYDLWQLFGGEHSEEIVNNKLQWSESSVHQLVRAEISYGIKKTNGIPRTEADVYQPLKYSSINYTSTVGAVKLGGANINDSMAFLDDNIPLQYMTVDPIQSGIQLDKEHHADNSVLSLMTLVISAINARGLKPESSYNVYKALESISEIGLGMFVDELGKLNLSLKDNSKFKEAVTKVILESVLGSSLSEDDMLYSIAHILFGDKFTGKNTNIQITKKDIGKLPYSSSEIFRKVVSALSTSLTKKSIRIKMPGILAVLNPTHNVLKFYKITDEDGKVHRVRHGKAQELLSKDNIFDILEAEQDKEFYRAYYQPLQSHQVEMGYKYAVKHADGSINIYKIVRPDNYSTTKVSEYTFYNKQMIPVLDIGYMDFRDIIDNVAKEREKAISDGVVIDAKNSTIIAEWLRDGQDLLTYNVRFTTESGKSYQMADLSIVLDYFTIKAMDNNIDKLKQIFAFAESYGRIPELARIINKHYMEGWKGIDPRLYPNIAEMQRILGNGDPVQLLFNIINLDPSTINLAVLDKLLPTLLRYGTGFMNREMQRTLNSISPSSNSVEVSVKVKDNNGNYTSKVEKVDKSSILILNYGVVMPKVFKSNFGLDTYDSVDTIKNDPYFFLKKFVNNAYTKVSDIVDDTTGEITPRYHLELKRLNGDHIYIKVMNNLSEDVIPSEFVSEVKFPKKVEDGKVYRIYFDKGKEKILYQLASESDRIFLDNEGNEVIVTSDSLENKFADNERNEYDLKDVKYDKKTRTYKTKDGTIVYRISSNIQSYLDNMDYFTININTSQFEDSEQIFEGIKNKALTSRNRFARKLARKLNGDHKENIATMKKLNNFNNILDNLDNPNHELDSNFDYLKGLSDEIYTSFIKSLEIIAARIPAQSMQSFMAMTVQDFENNDVNNAFVSIFQFYLQGSDLDIDAVSLQTFDIDENGLFQGHSPYYNLGNLDLAESSKSLPFPTGRQIIVEDSKAEDSTLLKYVKKGMFGNKGDHSLFTIYFDKNHHIENVKLNIDLNTVHMEELKTLLYDFVNDNMFLQVENSAQMEEALKNLNWFLRGKFNDDDLRKLEDAIINVVNYHNLYLKRVNSSKRNKIINNFITQTIIDIIKDPINRKSADSSVDEVTKPAKSLAKKSPVASKQNYMAPGNVFDVMKIIVENAVGKDDIAISATGLKELFAINQMYILVLNNMNGLKPEESKKAIDALTFDVKIGGKSYNILANAFSTLFKEGLDLDKINTDFFKEAHMVSRDGVMHNITSYLEDLSWGPDVAHAMSAMLGLSADNAKELVLAKINASTTMMGAYLYGMAIGVPIETLYRILGSNLAFRLNELAKGDIFNDESGFTSLSGVIGYLSNEPVEYLNRFNKVDFLNISDVLQPYKKLTLYIRTDLNKNGEEIIKEGHELTDIINNIIFEKGYYDSKAYNNVIEYFKKLRDRGADYYNREVPNVNVYSQAVNKYQQAIDYAIVYINDVIESRINKNSENEFGYYDDLFLDIDTLAMGGDEMKTLGLILRVNLGIASTPEELISLISKVENLISNRINKIRSFNNRHPNNKFKPNYISNNDVRLYSDMMNPRNNYKIDLIRFFTEEEYALGMIHKYDMIKQSFNPLRIIHDVPHFRGYWKTAIAAHTGNKSVSAKYRVLSEVVDSFAEKYHIFDSRLRKIVEKNGEEALDIYFRRKWLLNYYKNGTGFSIVIPPSSQENPVYVFTSGTNAYRINKVEREIKLGTALGDANFKLWVEKTLIPRLKRENNTRQSEGKEPNIFIRDLIPTVAKTSLGVTSINYSLPINMLPSKNDEYTTNKLREYREAFRKLQQWETVDIGNKRTLSIPDIFYLYSLITTNGKVGPYSIHNALREYDLGMVIRYWDYIAKLDDLLTKLSNDEDPSKKTEFDTIKGQILTDKVLAPYSHPKRGSDIYKYRDGDSPKVALYTKEKTNNTNNYDGNGNWEEEYDPNIEAEYLGDYGYDEEGDYKPKGFPGFTKGNTILPNSDYNYFNYAEEVATEDNTTSTLTSSKKYRITLQYDFSSKEYGKILDIEGEEDNEILIEAIANINKEYKGKFPTVTVNVGTPSLRTVADADIVEKEIERIKCKH